MATKKETASATPKFTKAELLGAAVFFNRKDALSVVIKDGETLYIRLYKSMRVNIITGEILD